MLQKSLIVSLGLVASLQAVVIQKTGSLIDISLIADMTYVSSSVSGDDKELLEIDGFTHVAEEEAHTHGAYEEGFNLNYAEIGLSSTVDPYFDLYTILHLSETSIEIEEAFFVTKKLPVGIKVGKFYSNLGRINSQHEHYWSFASKPLVYEALLGDENLGEKGIAFSYVLPTDSYFSFGLEILRGENDTSFGSDEVHDEAKGIEIEAVRQPGLFIAYVKNSFDFSDRLTLADNISIASGKANQSELSDANTTSHAYEMDTTLINVGMVLRYDFSSYSHVSLEAEYMQRMQEGTDYAYDATTSNLSSTSISKNQAGYYVMLAHKIDQNYGWALRYDALSLNEVTGETLPEDLDRYTGMMEYNPSEFSKIRLEYVRDNASSINNIRVDSNKILLQFNLIIGTHKAHTF